MHYSARVPITKTYSMENLKMVIEDITKMCSMNDTMKELKI